MAGRIDAKNLVNTLIIIPILSFMIYDPDGFLIVNKRNIFQEVGVLS